MGKKENKVIDNKKETYRKKLYSFQAQLLDVSMCLALSRLN